MALETELKKLNNHLGELIPVLTALAAGRPATVVDDEEVNEPAEEEETTVVEEPEEEAAVAEEKPVKRKRAKPPAITLDMIRDAVRAYTAAHGPDEGRALLKEKGGVNKLSELDEVDYPAVYEAFLIKEAA